MNDSLQINKCPITCTRWHFNFRPPQFDMTSNLYG